MHDDIHPTPIGLLRCLQVLAEEAAWLKLARTEAALHQAIDACRTETACTLMDITLQTDFAVRH